MKNKEILRKIYYGNRAINRNIQRLANISLIGLLARSANERKKDLLISNKRYIIFYKAFSSII